jgi:hypothetical protein
VATVIKYLDNIAKNFATTISVVLSCLLSAMFMGFELTVSRPDIDVRACARVS